AGQTATLANVGTLVINSNGSYSFTPVANYYGHPPVATYTISDGNGSSDATLSLNVTPVGPVAVADSQTAIENTGPLTGTVLANDTDVNGLPLTVTQFVVNGSTYAAGQTATLANVGTLVINSNGSYSFTPVANYYGHPPVATYTISDGNGSSDATLSLNVTPVGPTAVADSQTIVENTIASGNVITNDTDINGKAISVTGFDVNGSHYAAGSSATLAGVGTLVIAANGAYTFTPATNYYGPVPVATYQISDSLGTASSTLTLNVTPNACNTGISIVKLVEGIYSTGTGGEGLTPGYWKNHTPDCYGTASEWYKTGYSPTDSFNAVFGVNVAGNPSLLTALSTGGGGLIALMRQATSALLSTSDPNISYLYSKAQIISMTQQAILTGQYDGVQNLFAAQNNLEADLTTAASASTTVVTPMMDANTAADSVTIRVNGEALFAYKVTNTGTAALANVQVTDNVVSNVTYVSGDANHNGLLDVGETWTYTDFAVVSSVGVQATSATVTAVNAGTGQAATASDMAYINVTASTPAAPNSAPTQSLPTSLSINEDSALALGSSNGKSITVADADGDRLTTTLTVANGTLTLVSNGGATLTGNGTGTVTLVGTAAQINAALASFSYKQSVADWNGTDTLTVTTSDGVATTTNTTSITVTPVADIANDVATTNMNTAVAISVAANDTFENASHPITAVNGLAITAGGAAVAVSHGTVSLNAAGQLVFTPTTNYTGAASFTYTVTSGGVTETATVGVTVNSANHAPTQCLPTCLSTCEDSALNLGSTYGTAITVADVDGGTLTTRLAIANGTLHLASNGGATLSGNDTGLITLVGTAAQINAALASVKYTQAVADWNGTDTLTVSTSDGLITTTNSTSITVTPVADIVDNCATTNFNTAVTLNVLANDSFENATHPVTAINGHAIASGTSVAVTNGTVSLDASGQLVFTPATNYAGNASFTYTVTSGGVTETATVTITVAPNHAPTANDDCVQVSQSCAKILSWEDLAGGGDRDYNDAIMKVVTNADGSVTVTFQADNAGYNNSIGYYVKDANGNPATGKVLFSDSDTSVGHSVTIPATVLAGKNYGFFLIADGGHLNGSLVDNTSVSFSHNASGVWSAVTSTGAKLVGSGANIFFDDAQFNSDSYTTGTTRCGTGNVGEGMTHVHATTQVTAATASGNVLTNDTDPEHDTLTVTAYTQAAHGTVAVAANGAFTYAAAAGYTGSDSFTYTISDGHGGTDTATVNLGNHASVCVDHQATWTQGGCAWGKTVSIDLSKYCQNPEGGALHYSFDSATSGHGSYSDCNYSVQNFDANTGCLTLYVRSHGSDSWIQDGFTPDLKFSVTDGNGNCSHGDLKVNAWDSSPGSPIAFDLNGNGQIDVTGQSTARDGDHGTLGKTVQFDLNGDGKLDTIEWLKGTGDGLLVDNRDGNAASDMNGNRLFGNDATHDNGYAKLAELDTNHDGKLTGDELKGLQIWVDNGDAQVQAGELHALTDFGITSINVGFNLVQDAHGDSLTRSSASTSDGGSLMTEDIWFGALGSLSTASAAPALPALGDMLTQNDSLDSVLGSATQVTSACAGTPAPIACAALSSLAALANLADQHQPVVHA
ncbi:MAG: Ig-like domain-containing protein, partial [Rhodocyclaceae bacterium]|nr:Ig-like domain-containing protein [Rhodocyclaceae bacterium]